MNRDSTLEGTLNGHRFATANFNEGRPFIDSTAENIAAAFQRVADNSSPWIPEALLRHTVGEPDLRAKLTAEDVIKAYENAILNITIGRGLECPAGPYAHLIVQHVADDERLAISPQYMRTKFLEALAIADANPDATVINPYNSYRWGIYREAFYRLQSAMGHAPALALFTPEEQRKVFEKGTTPGDRRWYQLDEKGVLVDVPPPPPAWRQTPPRQRAWA